MFPPKLAVSGVPFKYMPSGFGPPKPVSPSKSSTAKYTFSEADDVPGVVTVKGTEYSADAGGKPELPRAGSAPN